MTTTTYPQRFGPYVLERFLAAGGMAEVFVASRPDGRIRGPIALKRMLPAMMENPEYAGMFRDEAALAAKLVHENIVRVYDSGEYDGRLYMAMELVEGLDASSLQKKLRAKNEMLGVVHALRIGVDLCQGLAHAHAARDERGVALMLIHRDVSPQNILIARDGRVKVTDFGVAKATGRETHTATGNIKGKIPYMAPEQALAQHIDQRVDQFAAAVVVWELLTASRLFHDKNDLLMFEKIIRRPTPKPSSVRPGIPPSVDNALLRALAKNPDERFPDVGSFGRALQKALQELGGATAADLAAIVDYVLPAAVPSTSSQELRQPSSPGSQATPASRPTGAPMGPAPMVDERDTEAWTPAASLPAPPTPATSPAPAMRPQPPPQQQQQQQQQQPQRPRTGLSVMTPGDAPTIQRSSSPSQLPSPPPPPQLSPFPSSAGSQPSQPSAPALTLDRSRRAPPGVEMQQPSVMMGAPAMVAPEARSSVSIVAVVVAVVVGVAAGFGIAKATASAPAPASSGCARPATATADVEAAYDLLLKSQMELEAGDLAKAAERANEAQARSGTAKGHYMLGRLRLRSGDTGSALNHFRCVYELAPGGDEAQKVASMFVK